MKVIDINFGMDSWVEVEKFVNEVWDWFVEGWEFKIVGWLDDVIV